MERQERVVSIDLRDPAVSARARNRLSVLLDMNVWIDLAEGETHQASRLRRKLRKLVGKGSLFCPLAPTIIWELYRQSYASAIRVAALMEELSLGISFALAEEIYCHEVDAVFEGVCRGTRPPVDLGVLFVPVSAHISSLVQLRFPNVAAFKAPEAVADQIAWQARNMGLVKYCQMTQALFSMPKGKAPGYAETALLRKEIAGKSREKARRVEEEAVLRSLVTPRFKWLCSQLSITEQLEFCERITRLPVDRYGGAARCLISSMPSVDHRINVFSLVGQDPGRRDDMNDFFDLELMMAPYVYSTVLVTKDGWIKSILEKLGGKYRCLGTYDALEELLDGLDAISRPSLS